MSVVVFGGYGVFGSRVSRELARRGSRVTVAGRHLARASRLADELGSGHRGYAADVRDGGRVRAALSGHAVAVHCAGPFSARERTVLEACLESGCHYVDIADDRGYVAMLREHDARFRAAGLTAAFGCSSLPGLSGALAAIARSHRPETPARARVTLFIGNDNDKSATSARSVLGGLGLPIRAPQGTLRVFRDHERVALPAPFGRRTVHVLDSPEYDLLPALGIHDVRVLVGFENPLAGTLFALLARAGWRGGPRVSAVVAVLGGLLRGGSSGGTVIVEMFWPGGGVRVEGLHAARDGQRLAALPAALAACALEDDPTRPRGAVTASELLGAGVLVASMEAAGFIRVRA